MYIFKLSPPPERAVVVGISTAAFIFTFITLNTHRLTEKTTVMNWYWLLILLACSVVPPADALSRLQQAGRAALVIEQRVRVVAVLGAALLLSPGDALARNAASERFAEAEVAMSETVTSYKSAMASWSKAKKLLDSTINEISSGKAATQKIIADVTAVEAKLSSLLSETAELDGKLVSDIAVLQSSTALKYQAAEMAALPESKKRPAYTASLFARAADEATVLAKSESLLQSFREGESRTSQGLKKLSTIISETQTIVTTLDAVEAELQVSTEQLKRGISPALREISLVETPGLTSNLLEGSKLFSTGAQAVEQESNRAVAALKTLQTTCKALTLVDEDFESIYSRLSDTSAKTTVWEKQTKLSARVAFGAIRSTADKLKALENQAASVSARACDASVRQELRAAEKREREKPSVNGLLKDVAGRLEFAEKRARETDALIKQATERGREEASRYRQFIPASLPGP